MHCLFVLFLIDNTCIRVQLTMDGASPELVILSAKIKQAEQVMGSNHSPCMSSCL